MSRCMIAYLTSYYSLKNTARDTWTNECTAARCGAWNADVVCRAFEIVGDLNYDGPASWVVIKYLVILVRVCLQGFERLRLDL